MANGDTLPRKLAQVARALQNEHGSEDTLELAVKLAVDVINGAEDAAITLVQRRGRVVETPAYTDERVVKVDQLQREFGEGPIIVALWNTEVVSCPDLANESRWGDWGPRAAELTGIGSMQCFRMFTRAGLIGALSVYSSRPHAFTDADTDSGIAFAAHAAVALAAARHDDQMETALDTRSMIGQATGILMATYEIDAVRAFAVLTRISQSSNVRLRVVAAELIRSRALPS